MKRIMMILSAVLWCMTSTSHAGTGHGLTADGALNTRVSKNASNVISITGGTTQGDNLFHSFSEFNVETGETAKFVGTSSLNNIISRVTGAHDSWIDGQLRTSGTTANLYLLNPNGVIFGPNASLDIQGSFHVSTADYLKFSDTDKFHADSARNSTLSVAAVEAFGFLGNSPGGISFTGIKSSNINFADGKGISIIGGEITIDEYSITGDNGRFIMVATSASGEVSFDSELRPVASRDLVGDITVQSSAELSSDDGGTFYITGNNFYLSQDSIISASTTSTVNGGDIVIDAAESVYMSDNARLNTSSSGDADAGSIILDAGGGLYISDESDIAAGMKPAATGTGKAGDISITVEESITMDNSRLTTTTSTMGDAGSITLNVGDSLYLYNGSKIASKSTSSNSSAGMAGNLYITAGESIRLTHGSQFTTESQNAGGGKIGVQTDDLLYLLNSWITTSVNGGDGKGGDIDIDPTFVILQTVHPYTPDVDNSRIQANAYGGPGGNITIAADYLLASANSVIEASSAKSATGEITMETFNFDFFDVLAALDSDLPDVTQWSGVPCALRSTGDVNRLVVGGGNAAPDGLDDFQSILPEALSGGLLKSDDNAAPKHRPNVSGMFEERAGDDGEECGDCR